MVSVLNTSMPDAMEYSTIVVAKEILHRVYNFVVGIMVVALTSTYGIVVGTIKQQQQQQMKPNKIPMAPHAIHQSINPSIRQQCPWMHCGEDGASNTNDYKRGTESIR